MNYLTDDDILAIEKIAEKLASYGNTKDELIARAIINYLT